MITHKSNSKRYPKTVYTQILQIAEYETMQVNCHIGRIWNYWFIQPSEKPEKLPKGVLPERLKGLDIGGLKEMI